MEVMMIKKLASFTSPLLLLDTRCFSAVTFVAF